MIKMKIKAIIFDLDGVLLFTDEYHYLAWKKIADGIGVYFDRKINNRLRGVSREESLEIILENDANRFDSYEKKAFLNEKNEYYKKLLQNMTPDDVEPLVRETLSKIKQMGYKIAIGSSSKNTKFILERVDMLNVFDAISDGTNITNSKPDPEVFVKAAQMLDVPAEQCCVIEDAAVGIQAAKEAGMVAIGIGDARNYPECDYKIDSLAELIDIITNY
ncbi:MAG: beta-phosphoglucomutase [Eubacteriales bacterium]